MLVHLLYHLWDMWRVNAHVFLTPKCKAATGSGFGHRKSPLNYYIEVGWSVKG